MTVGTVGTVAVSVEAYLRQRGHQQHLGRDHQDLNDAGQLLRHPDRQCNQRRGHVSDLAIHFAGSSTLRAQDGVLTSGNSNSFTVLPGTATSIVFLQGPTNVAAGVPSSPSISVETSSTSTTTWRRPTNPPSL